MVNFKAVGVSSNLDPALNTLSVVLAERVDRVGRRLELQTALAFDEQDRRLGQDTYCLSVENGATCYGGVSLWRLTAGSLEVQLDARAEGALGVEGGFLIHVAPESVAVLREALPRVLGEAKR